MDDEERETELRSLVARLDALVPRDGAHVTVGGEGPARATTGNRDGYLRLGLALLRAALDPLPASATSPSRLDVPLEGVLSEGSADPFGPCELDEAIVSRPPVQSRLGAVGQLAAGVAGVAALLAALVAVAVAVRWVLG